MTPVTSVLSELCKLKTTHMSFFEQLCGFCEFQGHLSGHRPLRHRICITSVADHRLPIKTVKQGDSMLCQDKALFVTGVLVVGGQQAGLGLSWPCCHVDPKMWYKPWSMAHWQTTAVHGYPL